VTESETMEGLMERISFAIPELLDVLPVIHAGPQDGRRAESTPVRVFLHADRQMVLSARGMGKTFDRELEALLMQAGCTLQRQGKGSHAIWWSPITQRTLTVPHGCKAAGLPKHF